MVSLAVRARQTEKSPPESLIIRQQDDQDAARPEVRWIAPRMPESAGRSTAGRSTAGRSATGRSATGKSTSWRTHDAMLPVAPHARAAQAVQGRLCLVFVPGLGR